MRALRCWKVRRNGALFSVKSVPSEASLVPKPFLLLL